MTFAIIAVVVLVVIVLFVLMSKKSADGGAPVSQKKLESTKPGAKSVRPEKAAAKAEVAATTESAAAAARSVRPEPTATPAKSAPPAPPRDLSGLRKGLAKARGEAGFLG